MVAALLEARRVTKAFGGGVFSKSKVNVALEDFSMTIQDSPPSISAIVGESGSGKTTFARTILGMTPPTSGEVLYRGTDLRRLDGDQRRQFLRDVQVIFQDPYEVYNPFYKVDHVLEVPVANFKLAPSKEKARALIEEALQAVGLRPDETLGRYPHQLSGGQRQRLMVARAMIMRPRLIIADEPVSMVDASLRATILDSLRDLNEKLGVSIIYITHDLTTAYQLSENIVVLYRGSIAEVGDVERVVNAPEHPYTRLLISSIPLPDLGRPWEKERVILQSIAGARRQAWFTAIDASAELALCSVERATEVSDGECIAIVGDLDFLEGIVGETSFDEAHGGRVITAFGITPNLQPKLP
ncbi:MAG: ABC transporter ATP-binding protein, partial [Proteobacteria bacterium]|nr:ABC transporter ATP-binding protein [Pseudomonadota bacterium]